MFNQFLSRKLDNFNWTIGKLDNLIPNHHLIFKVLKNKTETMDAISILSRTFFQNVLPIENTVLSDISSKMEKKHFWLALRTKCVCKP